MWKSRQGTGRRDENELGAFFFLEGWDERKAAAIAGGVVEGGKMIELSGRRLAGWTEAIVIKQ